MEYSYAANKPVYLRMGKSDRGDIHLQPLTKLESGELLKIRVGHPNLPGLIATGSMVRTAVEIGQELNLAVWSAPRLNRYLYVLFVWQQRLVQVWLL
jgi:transketolase